MNAHKMLHATSVRASPVSPPDSITSNSALASKQLGISRHAHGLHGSTGVVVVFPSTPLMVSTSFHLTAAGHFGVRPFE